jgi:hypothetical protein
MYPEIPIIIPSMGRATRVRTVDAFPADRLTLCVPEREADEYRECNPEVEVVSHPDELFGINQKRQWVYEKWGTHVQVDDDRIGLFHIEHSGDRGDRAHPLEPREAARTLDRVASDAIDFGAFLFGVCSATDPRAYQAIRPIRTTGYVQGAVTGLVAGSKLSFHPGMATCSDYWISALNMYHHRKCWVDDRYTLVAHQGEEMTRNPGGLGLVRSEDRMNHDYGVLREHFGNDVIVDKQKANYARQAARGGISLRCPFA